VKKLVQLSFPPLVGLALLSGDVFASAATVSGTHCRPVLGSTYAYDTSGFQNTATSGSSTVTVSCTIPMDTTALGSTVTFRMQVIDNTSSGGFSCVPYVYSQSGSLLASGPVRTTSNAFVGSLWIGSFGNWQASVPGNVNTNVYTIQCTVPGQGSLIVTQHVH
jgi:hypothetical protein